MHIPAQARPQLFCDLERQPTHLAMRRSRRAHFWLLVQGITLTVGVTYGYRLAIMLAAVLLIPSRSITIPYRIVYLVFSICLIYKHRITIAAIFKKSSALHAFVIFWLFYGIRLLLDLQLAPPVELRLAKAEYFQFAIGGTLVPAIAFAAAPLMFWDRKLFNWLALIGFITTLLSVFLYRDYLGTDFRRVGATSDIAFGSINTAYLASSVLVLGLYLLFEKQTFKAILFAAAMIVPAIIGVALGATRGSVVAIAACLAALVFAKFRRGKFGWVACVLAVIVTVLPNIILIYYDLGSSLVDRFERLIVDEQITDSARFLIWEDSWKQFLDAPLLGSGLDEQSRLTYPHNVIIESFMATGIVGGIAFVCFLYSAIKSVFLLLINPLFCRQVGWVALLSLHYMMLAMVSGALYSNVLFWCFSVAVVSIKSSFYIKAYQPTFATSAP